MSPQTALPGADLHHAAVDAAMATAADLLGMQAVFIGGLSEDNFVFERLTGDLPGATEGQIFPRADSFCSRLLGGAPATTARAAAEPAYADARSRTEFGICSYVGIPLSTADSQGSGTFCAVDTREVEVEPRTLGLMRDLARVIEAHVTPAQSPVIRRTDSGWRVGEVEEHDLLSAMVLADLLAPPNPPRHTPAPTPNDAGETEQLKSTVRQLEHALAARIVVEQAIGAIAERHGIPARPAFERLRRAARSRGRKVQELAREVVQSTHDPAVPLPPELAARRR